MEMYTATGKLKNYFLTARDVGLCTTGDTVRIDTIFKCLPHFNIVSIRAVSPVVHLSNISSCQKNFFSFPVAVNNSIKLGSLVFCYKCL
jgi:hypothetical protein